MSYNKYCTIIVNPKTGDFFFSHYGYTYPLSEESKGHCILFESDFFLVFFGDTGWKLKITLFPVTLHDCAQKEWNKITEHLWEGEGEGYHSCIKKIKHLQLLLDPFLKFRHQSIAHLKYQKAEKSYR